MDHDEIRSLIPAYALGAVPDEEIGRIRDHILSCDECMAKADSYGAVTASLALAADPVPLPATFESRMLEQVREGRPQATPAAPGRSRPLAPVFAGAGALVLLLVFALALMEARNDVARERRIVAALLHGEGIELRGRGAIGRAVPSGDGTLFVATGLSEAPQNHVYQVWLMRGRGCPTSSACEVQSAGTFDVEDGLGVLEIDEPVSDWEDSAVTLELEGGADEPTTEPTISSFAAAK